jgi:tetratricopeptide (TPR) repeat protein
MSYRPDPGASSHRYRLLDQAGDCFQAELHIAERMGVEGFVKQLIIWQVRGKLCEDPEVVDLLVGDLARVANISGWSVCQVLDVWRTDRAISFATEHVAGKTLADGLLRAADVGQPLALPVALSIALEVARSLERAHTPSETGSVIHGDLRPEFVLIDYNGAVRVTGFGFGRFLPTVDPDGQWCTWHGRCYQPPERLKTAQVRATVDVFSLGALLAETATGQPPYGSDDPEVLGELLRAGTSPLPHGTDALPKDVVKVIERACASRPDDRYQSVEEMAADLARLLFMRSRVGSNAPIIREALGAIHTPPEIDDRTIEHSLEHEFPETTEPIRGLLRPPPGGTGIPLIGREGALRNVGVAITSATGGQGRSLLLVGQPGMGRSRMVTEVAQRTATLENELAWLSVQSRLDEKTVSYSALVRLLASAIGLDPAGDPARIAKKIDRLRAFGLRDQSLAAIRGLIGAGEMPDQARMAGLMGHALSQCVSSLSWEHTTIIAWDDLQWADADSLACLTQLLEELPSLPVVALLTATREFKPPWPQRQVKVLELAPLSRDEIAQLALARAPDATRIATDLLNALGRRSDGNPLLVEELITHLLSGDQLSQEDGELAFGRDRPSTLPTLEEIARERLERLDLKVRPLALFAALAGPALNDKVLARASDLDVGTVRITLEELADYHRLLWRTPAGLCFPHERLRKAVLAASEPETLTRFQGRLAQAIIQEYEEPDVGLADHAVSLFQDAGDQQTAARVCAETADWLYKRGDIRGAAERYERALNLGRLGTTLSPAAELELCLRTGRSAMHTVQLDLGETTVGRAVELADELADDRKGAQARVLLSRILARQGRLAEAVDLSRSALPMAKASGHGITLAGVYAAIAETMQQWGQYGPDLEYIKRALRIAEEEGDLPRVAEYLQLSVMHAAGTGQFEHTFEYLERARAIASTADDAVLTCQLFKAEGLLLTFSGDDEAGLRTNIDGIERSRRHGLMEVEIVMLHNAGDNHLHMGNTAEALYYFTESLHRSQEAHLERLIEVNEMYVGYIEASHLGAPAGFDRLQEAIDTGRQSGRNWNLAQGHQLMGRALLEQGDRDGAIAHLQEALNCAQEANVKYFTDDAARWLERALASEPS